LKDIMSAVLWNPNVLPYGSPTHFFRSYLAIRLGIHPRCGQGSVWVGLPRVLVSLVPMVCGA